jgi:hypothetical protein
LGKIKSRRKGYADPTIATINSYYRLYRDTARYKGISFRLSRKRFGQLVKQVCAYCGVPPINIINNYLNKDGSRRRSHSKITIKRALAAATAVNGIDRIDNRYGYTTKNVTTCCQQCNAAKSGQRLEDFLAWTDRIFVKKAFE